MNYEEIYREVRKMCIRDRTYTLLMGNINYSILIMILVAIGGFKDKFNAWTKTDVRPIEKICRKLGNDEAQQERTTYLDLMLILGCLLYTSRCV